MQQPLRHPRALLHPHRTPRRGPVATQLAAPLRPCRLARTHNRLTELRRPAQQLQAQAVSMACSIPRVRHLHTTGKRTPVHTARRMEVQVQARTLLRQTAPTPHLHIHLKVIHNLVILLVLRFLPLRIIHLQVPHRKAQHHLRNRLRSRLRSFLDNLSRARDLR